MQDYLSHPQVHYLLIPFRGRFGAQCKLAYIQDELDHSTIQSTKLAKAYFSLSLPQWHVAYFTSTFEIHHRLCLLNIKYIHIVLCHENSMTKEYFIGFFRDLVVNSFSSLIVG